MTTTGDGVTHIGNTSVRILIPSRRKDGGIVDPELRNDWDGRARRQLETKPFGGATPTDVVGSFVHDDGRVTREKITVLASTCDAQVLRDDVARERILAFAKELCAKLGQESIFVGWGDEAYVVSATFDLQSVPVVPFTRLSEASQQKHLTMGWGGIDDPSKVLQVLSLDTWTFPSVEERAAVATASGLTLRAVQEEAAGRRRAWTWSGTLADLKAARKQWKGTSEPEAGDLVFLRSKRDRIDVVMLSARDFAGPRDLRQSQGQLNPVTRHLLLRILRREWYALAGDLNQKPLDQEFFPKLQTLRKAVQKAVQDAPQAVSHKPRGAGKKKDSAELEVAAEKRATREAFRTSVLVVGRMMFLRFLAQKGWIPKGLDGLLEPHQRYGAAYFDKFVKPLWFDVLNEPESNRSAATRAQFGDGFPYLNGGLFHPRPGERRLHLPPELFDPDHAGSFLRLFRDFEFSLNEFAGSDDSLRIDPSLFGRVLESFNSIDDRKSEGVHYTPKPIAWALACDAIVARVAHLSGVSRERILGLLDGERVLTGQQASRVSRILGELRIIDPAVGSGVLLWACLEVLLALDSACAGLSARGDGYQRGSHDWGVRSRHFVCNCLYGVDISEEAVELTRLRLWLAVALSEDEPRPLPDLELNICRGDSLLPAQGQRAKAKSRTGRPQMSLGFTEKDQLENELIRLTRAYLAAGTGESEQGSQDTYRVQVEKVRRKLFGLAGEAGPDELPLNWRGFFPHVFGDAKKNGFDVVVANPPYIRIQSLQHTAGAIYRETWSTLAKGNADLSFAFVELALRDLAAPDHGQVAFIQPNFRHLDAADAVRKLLLGRREDVPASLRLWVDFDDLQVFPTATNYVSLLFAERTPAPAPQSEFTYSNPVLGSWTDEQNLGWLRPVGGTHSHPAEGEWLTLPMEQRDRLRNAHTQHSRKLKDVAEVHVGLQTSADAVFLFRDEDLRKLDATENAKPRKPDAKTVMVVPRGSDRRVVLERGILRRCLKGSAGDGYSLLFPYDATGALLTEAQIQESYPKAWAYLSEGRTRLEGREKGRFANEEWYRFGRSQGFAVATQPKVLVPALLRKPVAIIDRDGTLTCTASGKGGGGAWALVPRPGSGVTLDDLAAIVTSEAAWAHIRAYGAPQLAGWRGVDGKVLEDVPA